MQARAVIADLRNGQSALELPQPAPPSVQTSAQPQGTFSLIFDTEQLGGVKFGLPRILALLDRYGVSATFFCTGFVQDVYPQLLPSLAERGHEVGIHGLLHEWMAGMSLEEQRRRLALHLEVFRQFYPVVGANFIFRADANTIRALVESGVRYCVAFALHHYRPFAYRQVSMQPAPIVTPAGGIWLVPVPVETYDWPWFGTRLAIDSALNRSSKESGKPHVSVLMHPFRDGTKRHLRQLERMLDYLTQTRQLKPLTLEQLIAEPAPSRASTRVYMNYLRVDGSHPDGNQREFWSQAEYYWERLATIYQGLKAIGQDAALSVDAAAENTFAVHPEDPNNGSSIPFDPIAAGLGQAGSPEWEQMSNLLREAAKAGGAHVFSPPDPAEQKRLIRKLNKPRRAQDVSGFPPEVAIRLVYRFRKGRPVF
jgi:peptidoglycan/xylan/chitin deacetylase (PgdA/CDA1 family)